MRDARCEVEMMEQPGLRNRPNRRCTHFGRYPIEGRPHADVPSRSHRAAWYMRVLRQAMCGACTAPAAVTWR